MRLFISNFFRFNGKSELEVGQIDHGNKNHAPNTTHLMR